MTQEQVRNSRGKRVISVRATEALLYLDSSAAQPQSRCFAGFNAADCPYSKLEESTTDLAQISDFLHTGYPETTNATDNKKRS